jgi:hypothetical protein
MKITHAAVKIKDLRQNKIICIPCHRHCDAFRILKEFGYKLNQDYQILEQGFLNEYEQFLNRQEAYFYAKQNGQIDKTEFENCLYSEDLW